MRRRLLKFLATFTFRRAWLIMPVVAALAVAAAWLADTRMSFDTSLIAFLPAEHQQSASLGELFSDYRKLEPVMAVVRTKDPGETSAELIAVAREMAHLLDDERYFTTPVYKIDEVWRKYYESLSDVRLIMLLTSRDWSELQRLMSEKISSGRLAWAMADRISLVKPPHAPRERRDDPLGALQVIRNRLASSRGPTRLDPVDGYLLSADRNAIAILMHPVRSPDNGRDAYRTLGFLEDCREFLFKTHPSWRGAFEVEFEGSLVTTARELRQMKEDQQLILKIAAPLALLLILLVFRKVEAFIFILLPPAVGLAWTFGLSHLAFGGISVVTAGFLVVIVAIGIQYNVHLYHRFILELYRTHNYYRALTRSYLETGRGILASAVVVMILFFMLFATSLRGVAGWSSALETLRDSRGFGQLGVVAGLGILCNLVACLLSLPLLASVKHWLAKGGVKPVALYRFHIERLYEPALTNPRATLLVLLLVTVILCHPTQQLDFQPVSVSPFLYRPSVDREMAAEAKKADFPRPGRPIIAMVRGKTRQEALERNDQLYENLLALDGQYNILAYDSLRTVLPSLRSQKASLNRLSALDLEPFRAQIQAASAAAGFQPEYFEPFIRALQSLKEAAAAAPKYIDYTTDTDDELFEALSKTAPHYMTKRQAEAEPGGMGSAEGAKPGREEYVVTTVIYPHEDGFPRLKLNRLAADLKKNSLDDLTLIGDPLIERDLSRLVKFNLAVMILLSAFVIYLALLLHFRSARLTWLTFLPVLVELVWLGGLMALAGIQIHFFTVLAMPLVLCLAMDNALQLTQYFHDRRPCSVRHVMLSVGRVPMLTCGMTALLYGTLALASYPGMRDCGAVVLFATGATLVGAIMLLPALLMLFGRGQAVLESLMVESEEV